MTILTSKQSLYQLKIHSQNYSGMHPLSKCKQCSFKAENNYLNVEDLFKELPSATAFAVKSLYHITYMQTQTQSVFGWNKYFLSSMLLTENTFG